MSDFLLVLPFYRPRARNGEHERLSTLRLLAYVNMKASLIFCDLAVGVAIPVYLEVLSLDIGTAKCTLLAAPRCARRACSSRSDHTPPGPLSACQHPSPVVSSHSCGSVVGWH